MARAEREQHKRGVEHMRRQVSPKAFSAFWESRFLGQIRRDVPVTEHLSDGSNGMQRTDRI